MADHLNVIERALIDNLRTGTYNTTAGIGSGSAWSSGDITVFGQYPEMVANGIEEQFMGQMVTSGASSAIGELYGVGFNLYMFVESGSSMTVDGAAYKQRRLLNYLMNNVANVCMDTSFTSSNTEVTERHYTGFRNIGYNQESEIWTAMTSMIIVFKNTR